MRSNDNRAMSENNRIINSSMLHECFNHRDDIKRIQDTGHTI